MKTIFLPISSRMIARNILRTGVLHHLLAQKDIRVIIFTQSFKISGYEKEFNADNIIFEGIDDIASIVSEVDSLFNRLALFYINSGTARFLRKQWLLYERQSMLRYAISLTILTIIGGSPLLRRLLRMLDYWLVSDERFSTYFATYYPDLVFLPRVDTKLDRSFLRHAKHRGIPTIGMINSWDNITLAKYPFRILPDHLIVHNEILKAEAVRYLDMPEKRILVSGMPHFDHYVTTEHSSREAFCARYGIDPKKRIILFASIAPILSPDEWEDIILLEQAWRTGKLHSDTVLLVRHHPVANIPKEKIPLSPFIIWDDSKTTIYGEKTYTEILHSDMQHLADVLYHTAMTLTTCSTMSIDASAFDKPVINIAFDGWEKRPFHESVRRFYEPSHEHYQPIVKSGGVRIARSFNELLAHIHTYLEDPSRDREGRARIVREQCYKLDGKSGQRIAEFILSELK